MAAAGGSNGGFNRISSDPAQPKAKPPLRAAANKIKRQTVHLTDLASLMHPGASQKDGWLTHIHTKTKLELTLVHSYNRYLVRSRGAAHRQARRSEVEESSALAEAGSSARSCWCTYVTFVEALSEEFPPIGHDTQGIIRLIRERGYVLLAEGTG